ncbi:acyl-CoA desaturase, partial [bacterium]|nr:acyl-CoA desaturase [bacterium]
MSKSPSPIDFTVPSLVRRKRIHAFLSLTVPFGLTIFALANMGSLSSSELIQLAVLTLMMYCVGQLGITLGFHRLFSHQSFRPNRAITIILGIAGSMTAQGPILNWVSDHRRHHSFGDIPGDPHSPHTIPSPNGDIVPGKLRGFWHAQAGWLFSDSITNMAKYSPDLLRNRLIVWLSNRYFYWVALGLAIPTLFGWWFIGGWRGAALGML